MKPYKILIFIILAFASLGTLGWFFPQDGIKIGEITWHFPHPYTILVGEEHENEMDIEANLQQLKSQTDVSQQQSVMDSLIFYKDYVNNNAARLYFPDNNFRFYDHLFGILASSSKMSKAVHIVHYGDSQIEMDRISSTFRHRLQQTFGGSGAGMIPAIHTIPTFTISQSYSGALERYVIYGDVSQPRATHRRYGLMANVAEVYGSASVSMSSITSSRTFANTKTFNRIVLLLGNNAANFSATCAGQTQQISAAKRGVTRMEWTFQQPLSRATVSMNGTAEIYGISMESTSGVAVDNVPMRGCSGTIFTRIDSSNLSQCYSDMNVRLIIMQYGGNMMPQINSQAAIDNYMKSIARQIKYVKHCNPNAEILFIGPSDMSKRINGKMQTYPYLLALNEALKKTVLDNGGAYWDMFHVMGGENSMVAWVKHNPAWAGGDYVHFTEAGAIEIANTLSDAFLVHYQFYLLRKRCPQELLDRFMKMK